MPICLFVHLFVVVVVVVVVVVLLFDGICNYIYLQVEIRYGVTAYSLIIGLVVVASLMVIPKLILVWRDKKDQNEYGAIPLLKDRLSDNDFAVQLRTRVDTLEEENSQLKKQLRGTLKSIKKESSKKDSKKKDTLGRKGDNEFIVSNEVVAMDEIHIETNENT